MRSQPMRSQLPRVGLIAAILVALVTLGASTELSRPARADDKPAIINSRPKVLEATTYLSTEYDPVRRRLTLYERDLPTPPPDMLKSPKGRWVGPWGGPAPRKVLYLVDEAVDRPGKGRILWVTYLRRPSGRGWHDTLRKFHLVYDRQTRSPFVFMFWGLLADYTTVDAIAVDAKADLGPADRSWPCLGGARPWPPPQEKGVARWSARDDGWQPLTEGFSAMTACGTRGGILIYLESAVYHESAGARKHDRYLRFLPRKSRFELLKPPTVADAQPKK